ncbi:hypothetical protein Bca101_061568 [Brassica carinata]
MNNIKNVIRDIRIQTFPLKGGENQYSRYSPCSKVTVVIGSNSQSTSSPSGGTLLAPTQSTIMEKFPSPIIVSNTNVGSRDNSLAFIYSPTHESLSHKDGFTSDATANLNMS